MKDGLYAPRDVVSFEVHNGKYADFSASNCVEDAVRKLTQNGMPDFAIDDLILLGISFNQPQCCSNFGNKIFAEALALAFIPFGGSPDVSFCAAPGRSSSV